MEKIELDIDGMFLLSGKRTRTPEPETNPEKRRHFMSKMGDRAAQLGAIASRKLRLRRR